MLLAEANAQPVLGERPCSTVPDAGCCYTAPPACTARPHGQPTWSSATETLGAFSNKQARPPLCCPGIIYFSIPRAGLYFYLHSVSSSQMQPNHSDLGATLGRLIGCALLATVLCSPLCSIIYVSWPTCVPFIYISP
uniref:Uncharacterized protein n=1 Tax=Myotis myotis TaxID=51298 RepID=A0A7J7T694_MYOMY|nr:hypothetical protein mMyoMyo1_009264 [Myotis myotis]